MGIGCGCLMVIVAGMAAVLLGLTLLSIPAARSYRKAQERQKSQPRQTLGFANAQCPILSIAVTIRAAGVERPLPLQHQHVIGLDSHGHGKCAVPCGV